MDDAGLRALILAGVLVVATAAGLVWRARTGRVRPVRDVGPVVDVGPAPATAPAPAPAERDTGSGDDTAGVWADLGIEPTSAAVTLVQFSSAFCAPCRATRRILDDVASRLPDVVHVEIDAESHLDAVRALDVRSTPTTLLVDRAGRVTGRAVGQPRRNDVLAAVGPYLSPDT